MAKIGKREMIILGVMVLAILYGAYELLWTKRKAPPVTPAGQAQTATDLNKFVADMSARTEALKTTTLVFSRTEKEWTQDPFLDSPYHRAWVQSRVLAKAAPAADKVSFVYSGYLEAGKRSMAVINGMEYREGEPLDIPGFFLRSVTPQQVVIEDRRMGTTLDIPMQD